MNRNIKLLITGFILLNYFNLSNANWFSSWFGSKETKVQKTLAEAKEEIRDAQEDIKEAEEKIQEAEKKIKTLEKK